MSKMCIALGLLVMVGVTGVAQHDRARQLADAVFKASGGENWSKVKVIRFTFNVGQGDKTVLSAKHEWNVWSGTDTVSWGGKTVTVNVWSPAADEDSKAAYQRWVNDSYWLLAPLKLSDPGVTFTAKGTVEWQDKPHAVLHLAFKGTGLTPGDQYNLYVDPETHLVRGWDYMPNPEKKVSGSWEDYRDLGGLKLSLQRTFGERRIWFTDVDVLTESPAGCSRDR